MSKKSIFRLLLTILAGIGALILPALSAAQIQDGVKMTAQAGFDGYCKANQWIPVRVSLENSGSAIQGRIEARVSSSSGTTFTYAAPVDLPESSHKELFLYLNTDTYLSELPIYLTDGKQTIQSTTARLNCLAQTDVLFGVVASTPSAFNLLNELDPDNGSANVANIEIKALPDRPQGLEALDVLFFSNVDTAVLTSDQQEALANWLANGGRLVASGGAGWQKTTAGLGQFLPLSPLDFQDLSSMEALISFTNSKQPMAEGIQSTPISAGELKPSALVLVEQDGVPLVIHGQYGLGDVFYLAFDPAMEPFRTWEGMTDFYRVLLAYHFDLPGWTFGFQNWQMAQEAASSLPNVALPSAILVCGFLGIYVAVVGPANYLALRYLKRRELAWITIPVLVIVFSILSLMIGGITRGRTPQISQANIVQVWPDAKLARVDSLVSIYSPRRTTYQVDIPKLNLGRPIITYDMGSSQDMTFIEDSDRLTLPGLRVDIGGVETFAISGAADSFPIESQLIVIVNQSGATLQGQVINQSDQTLEDAVLLYPGGVLSLGDFAPSISQDISIPLSQAQITGRLQTTSYAPYTGAYAPTFTYPYYGYGYSLDSTLQDILGTTNYYDSKEIYQRYTLLNSVLSSNYNPMGRGGGVYLCGWTEYSALDIQLADRPARHNSTTLYLISITPMIETDGESLKLTPGMFIWEPMSDSASSRGTPYTGTIYANETQHLRFRLGIPMIYRSIEELILHLESTSTSLSAANLNISLWDFEKSQWVQMDNIGWGDYQVLQPERFVGPAGTIQLSIMNASTSTYDFTKSDFTLIVDH